MLSKEISKLEHENATLRSALKELNSRMEQGTVLKPKSCQYCKNYIQHYRKEGTGSYYPVHDGHCVCNVPIKKGRKSNPKPDDTCPYFELGTYEMKYI